MRVLLLNPPGERTYIRDYLCSKTTKSNYLFHPIDLLVLSGTLASEHETEVLDAVCERLAPDAAERAPLHTRIGRVHQSRGQLPEARKHLLEALARASSDALAASLREVDRSLYSDGAAAQTFQGLVDALREEPAPDSGSATANPLTLYPS